MSECVAATLQCIDLSVGCEHGWWRGHELFGRGRVALWWHNPIYFSSSTPTPVFLAWPANGKFHKYVCREHCQVNELELT
jgi:hypothetical protein